MESLLYEYSAYVLMPLIAFFGWKSATHALSYVRAKTVNEGKSSIQKAFIFFFFCALTCVAYGYILVIDQIQTNAL